jgi:hypothetical protein
MGAGCLDVTIARTGVRQPLRRRGQFHGLGPVISRQRATDEQHRRLRGSSTTTGHGQLQMLFQMMDVRMPL